MDKIWNRNPLKSKVIDRCGCGWKNKWWYRTKKSWLLKYPQKTIANNYCLKTI